MAEKRDYYEVLGLSKNATQDEIKKAYRKLAKENHPDLNPGDQAAEARFKEVSEAYEVLSDEEKKGRYDQFGHAGVDPNFAGGGAGGGFGGMYDFGDLGDLFGNIFSGGFGGSSRANRNGPRKGSDVRASVTISFMEAVHGCEKEVTISRSQTCSNCDGTGSDSKAPSTCPDCGGTGQQTVSQRSPFGTIQTTRTCSRCGGSGKVVTDPCYVCHGSGATEKTSKIKVKIPAGIDDDQIISVPGRGNAGANGGSSGDLLVIVSVRPDLFFEREGYDIWCEVPITYSQAVLGDSITIPSIDGKIKYNVPAGTQPSTVFRLRGKGIPNLRGRGKGDQYVRVVVEVPKDLNKQQKEALKTFESSLTNKNYEKRKGFFDKLKDAFN